jgi:hypothetical protein
LTYSTIELPFLDMRPKYIDRALAQAPQQQADAAAPSAK